LAILASAPGLQFMSDFGGKLRLAREQRGISLRQIAARTKISLAALEALERNDVSKLPGGIFTRAFVRSYANEVGLDPDETVQEFLERFQGNPVASSIVAPAISVDDSNFLARQRIAGLVLKLALISVPLIGLVLYLTLRSRPSDSRTPPPPTAATSPPGESAPVTSTPPVAPSVPGAVAVPTPPPPSTTPMTLEVHPTGECWVRLTIDGRLALSRLMVAGDKEVHQVRDTAIIEVGNAGTFAFTVDGRRGKMLGQSGQVRTARITRDSLAKFVE
jgi:cytoskeleton protein RodZ